MIKRVGIDTEISEKIREKARWKERKQLYLSGTQVTWDISTTKKSSGFNPKDVTFAYYCEITNKITCY